MSQIWLVERLADDEDLDVSPSDEGDSVDVQIGGIIHRMPWVHLETLVGLASQMLHEHRPAKPAKCIRPAEAVVDVDDLMESMASSYEVERARLFAPEEVP